MLTKLLTMTQTHKFPPQETNCGDITQRAKALTERLAVLGEAVAGYDPKKEKLRKWSRLFFVRALSAAKYGSWKWFSFL